MPNPDVGRSVSPLKWVDIDGDEGHLTTEDVESPGAIALLQIVDDSQHAVYVTADQAREIIAWLSARLWGRA